MVFLYILLVILTCVSILGGVWLTAMAFEYGDDNNLPMFQQVTLVIAAGVISVAAAVMSICAIFFLDDREFENTCRNNGGSYVDTTNNICYDSDRNVIDINIKPL